MECKEHWQHGSQCHSMSLHKSLADIWNQEFISSDWSVYIKGWQHFGWNLVKEGLKKKKKQMEKYMNRECITGESPRSHAVVFPLLFFLL